MSSISDILSTQHDLLSSELTQVRALGEAYHAALDNFKRQLTKHSTMEDELLNPAYAQNSAVEAWKHKEQTLKEFDQEQEAFFNGSPSSLPLLHSFSKALSIHNAWEVEVLAKPLDISMPASQKAALIASVQSADAAPLPHLAPRGKSESLSSNNPPHHQQGQQGQQHQQQQEGHQHKQQQGHGGKEGQEQCQHEHDHQHQHQHQQPTTTTSSSSSPHISTK